MLIEVIQWGSNLPGKVLDLPADLAEQLIKTKNVKKVSAEKKNSSSNASDSPSITVKSEEVSTDEPNGN